MKIQRLKIRLLGIILVALGTSCTEQNAISYTDYVNVFIGTGGHGHTFPGATYPHGMVQLSPDTRLSGWDACAGYYYDDNHIHGFTHTHLNGTGRGDYGDILFMPVVGEKPLQAGVDGHLGKEGYRSRFSHSNESARPGYYQVLLEDDSINVELTTTLRAGMHRYTYPLGRDNRLIVDMEPTIQNYEHPITEIEILNDSTISGMKFTDGWAKQHYVYFYAVFSTPFEYKLFADTTCVQGTSSISTHTAKALIEFHPSDNAGQSQQVIAKVGISSVDREGARKNVETEIPHWNFESVVKEADEVWNKELGRIKVETADATSRTIFYSSLYHTAIQPSLASDVDGRYRTMGQETRKDSSYVAYTVFSLWDTFRALHPLYTIIKPAFNQQLIKVLLRKYDEMGILPKWELASNETGTMIGYHAVSVIADAFMKGQCDFDTKKALEACVRSSVYDTAGINKAMNCSIKNVKVMPLDIKYKNEWGYIPCDKVKTETVSKGLEYAYNDWLIAQLACEMGDTLLYESYLKKGETYRIYFDFETKMMRARLSDGSWLTPFDPKAVERPGNYIEGNAWQWAWFVPHDVEGLIDLWGGKDAFAAGLDSLFTMNSDLTGDESAALDVTGMIGQYAHGNEPGHHVPYLYNHVGQYHKTQALVDSILYNLYRNEPDGLCGNEDVGQMSAWYVFSAMGLYPVCPGKPYYALGRPLFDKVVLHLENGKTLVIEAENNHRKNKYVSSVFFNGKPLTDMQLSHFNLMQGGTLKFLMKAGDE